MMLERINGGTAKAAAMRDAYDNADMTTLWEAYPSGYSHAKACAFSDCERMRDELNGWGLVITSKNTFVFTASFLYDDATTGKTMLVQVTPAHNYATEYDA